MSANSHGLSQTAVLAWFCASQQVMSADTFASLIGVLPKTEAEMRARRRSPPFFRRGNAVFYRFSDVSDWLLANRIEPSAPDSGQRAAARDLLA